jgi:hypothetical protein
MKPQYEAMLELAAMVAYAAGADALPHPIETADIAKNVAKLGKLASSIRHRWYVQTQASASEAYKQRTKHLEDKAGEIAKLLAVQIKWRGQDLAVRLGAYETTLG